LDLPEWFTVNAREGDSAELTVTIPALVDPDADLSDEQLAGVAGGFFLVGLALVAIGVGTGVAIGTT
jgi:hypothetical protein